MKNSKGFTLIELLAVVVILGILMTIAIPNTLSMIDKNKKGTYIENAKTFISLVKSRVKTDKDLEVPEDDTFGLIVTLGYLNTSDIENDPYGDEYDKDNSFVAITVESNKYVYRVHLVSCESSCSDNSSDWKGISLATEADLNSDDRYQLVSSSSTVFGDISTALREYGSVYGSLDFIYDDG